MLTIEQMKAKLQAVLKPKRFLHSVNVMEVAVALAKNYNVNGVQAQTAALLHDCAREVKGEEVFKQCDKFHINVDNITRIQPSLLHGAIGSKMAVAEYGICDEAVLRAIRYHTTGCAHMTVLDKIIFIADYIEPGRKFPGVEDTRKAAFEDIDCAMMMALDQTIQFIIAKGAVIHPDTIHARNWILMDSGGRG